MLHSPLTGSCPTTYTPMSLSNLDGNNGNNLENPTVPSGLPAFFPSALSIPAIQPQFKSPLHCVPNSLGMNVNLYGTPQSSLTLRTEGTNSLSGSSSLSSSLVSLHSTPPNSSVFSHKACQLGTVQSTPRCSLWLKLQVCPSWQTAATTTGTPSSTANTDTSSDPQLHQVTTNASGSDGKETSADNTEGNGNQCPFPPNTCPYAHPTRNIQVENGFVTVCYDFIKRKNCKHSCCKYYHPPAHQIEAILKRGDEQKKLLENQQKLLESKTTALLNMHPAQPPAPNGISGVCATGLPWPSTSLIQPSGSTVYGAYITPGSQPLSVGLNQLGGVTLPLPFASGGSDPNALNTTALLAAAAALQQQHQQQSIPGSGLLVTASPSAKVSVVGEPAALGYQVSTASRGSSLLPTSVVNGLYTGPNSLSNKSLPSGPEPWCPTKRSNNNTYSGEVTPKAESAENGSSGAMCNGNGSHSSQDRPSSEPIAPNSITGDFISDANGTPNPIFSSTAAGLTFSPAFYGSVAPPLAPPSGAVSSLLNPMNVNLYGLPLSTGQPGSPYVSPQIAPYSTVYSAPGDNPTSMATAAAALALNNWLQQQPSQQPQQPQPTATPTHPLFSTQVPGAHHLSTPSTLAAALAAVQHHHHQQQPHSSTDLHSAAVQPPQSPAFQQSQQQALLLSTLIRAQQSQLAAAQMAAAVHAAGYLQTGSSSRPIGMLDTSYQLPGTLGGLQPAPYPTAFPCVQNPITNVAYINDKGHLLETLPICRDFKAGKCHRNGDCRYVHLVDENVEVNQGRVIVCRDAAKGRCTRVPCKYYHVPLHAISANRSLALNSVLANASGLSGSSGSASGAGAPIL